MTETRVVNMKLDTSTMVDVVIGRPTMFGNPIRVRKPCCECGVRHGPGETLECYREWLWRKLKRDKAFAREVRKLHGKVLGCWCKPNPCHGDVLARAAAYLNKPEGTKWT